MHKKGAQKKRQKKTHNTTKKTHNTAKKDTQHNKKDTLAKEKRRHQGYKVNWGKEGYKPQGILNSSEPEKPYNHSLAWPSAT